MDVNSFDYHLPPSRIAQEGVTPRDTARLLTLDRRTGCTSHGVVRELPRWLAPGDLLVLNDTQVVPARVYGLKSTGGQVELLLLERLGADAERGESWRVLLGASRSPRAGAEITLPGGFRATVERSPDSRGEAVVSIRGPASVEELVRDHGQAPLPPYIRRAAGDPRLAADRERYQTVFARRPGAVAAPTAGLHLTQELLDRLAERGIFSTTITLHVGEASFWPVRVAEVEAIDLPPERFEVPDAAAQAIAATRARRSRIVAVGTTVVRALESLPRSVGGAPAPDAGATRLFIAPGHRFRFVDALLTNFHLPRSPLLMLVSAFAGREAVLGAYREAVRLGYRFYSYGDAMLIL